ALVSLPALSSLGGFPTPAARARNTVRQRPASENLHRSGHPPRSKRRQRCTCSWTTLTALTPRKRRNPEDLRRVPFLIHLPSGQRYGCNWPVQWCRAVAIFPARASRQVRFPLAETRTRGKTLPVRPFGTYDSLICQRPPWMYLSELGWEIPVDFKADAHFDESRSCP